MNRLNDVLSKADRVIGILTGVSAAASGIAVVLVTFLVGAYVVSREFLGGGWVFVEEWGGYIMVLIVYCGLAYALRSESHINVDLVIRRLPKSARLWMGVGTSLVALGMLIFYFLISIEWIVHAVENSLVSSFPSLTPMWIPFTFVTVGLGVFVLAMALYLALKVWAAVRGVEEEAKALIEE